MVAPRMIWTGVAAGSRCTIRELFCRDNQPPLWPALIQTAPENLSAIFSGADEAAFGSNRQSESVPQVLPFNRSNPVSFEKLRLLSMVPAGRAVFVSSRRRRELSSKFRLQTLLPCPH